MTPIDLPPLTPAAPTTPVRRVEPGGQQHQPPRRRPPDSPQHATPDTDTDTVDADGHIDTHV